jgi:hypothetical protein
MHLREDMSPFIVNLDSAFDWTPEIRQIWERIDWGAIRQGIAAQIPSESWTSRGNELRLVGLVSNLVIDDAYDLPQCKERRDRVEEPEDPLSREWRERQLGTAKNERDGRNHPPNRRPRLSGEEPFFRSPCSGKTGVVECYGIYVDDVAAILSRRGLLQSVPVTCHHAPAILLCPERIHDIYPTVARRGEGLRHFLPLASNPALVNLRLTLLHELGHHFFPVHRSGSGRFLGEALANLFCYHGLSREEQAWLLYKSWLLQPPEYSAYRPLSVLCEADADWRLAVGMGFHGGLNGWRNLPTKGSHSLERHLGASLTMALASDAAACKGLWWDELRNLVTEENRWLLNWESNHLHFHMRPHDDGYMPGDLVLDLYRRNDLAPWTTNRGLPADLWASWGYGDDVSWPEDCLGISDDDADGWVEIYDQTSSGSLARTVRAKMSALKSDPGVAGYVSRVLTDPAHRPTHRPLNDAIEALSWMLDTYPEVPLGELWSGPLAEFANGDPQYSESRGWGGSNRMTYALNILTRIPGFRARPTLNQALDQAATFVREGQGDWHHRVQAIQFIEACGDRSAIPALEVAAVSTEGYAKPVREAASKAIANLGG